MYPYLYKIEFWEDDIHCYFCGACFADTYAEAVEKLVKEYSENAIVRILYLTALEEKSVIEFPEAVLKEIEENDAYILGEKID